MTTFPSSGFTFFGLSTMSAGSRYRAAMTGSTCIRFSTGIAVLEIESLTEPPLVSLSILCLHKKAGAGRARCLHIMGDSKRFVKSAAGFGAKIDAFLLQCCRFCPKRTICQYKIAKQLDKSGNLGIQMQHLRPEHTDLPFQS